MPRGGKSKAAGASIGGSKSKSSSDDAAAAAATEPNAVPLPSSSSASRSGPASQPASAPTPPSAPASRCDNVSFQCYLVYRASLKGSNEPPSAFKTSSSFGSNWSSP
jgi:hypothetical protein